MCLLQSERQWRILHLEPLTRNHHAETNFNHQLHKKKQHQHNHSIRNLHTWIIGQTQLLMIYLRPILTIHRNLNTMLNNRILIRSGILARYRIISNKTISIPIINTMDHLYNNHYLMIYRRILKLITCDPKLRDCQYLLICLNISYPWFQNVYHIIEDCFDYIIRSAIYYLHI